MAQVRKMMSKVLKSVGLGSKQSDLAEPTEVVAIPATAYMPNVGALGVIQAGVINWYTCRDQFQNYSNDISEFAFYYGGAGVADIVEFMRTFEQIIRLPDEHALTISKTNVANVLFIRMGDWWKYPMRRSLLTALLRCAQAYTNHSGEGFQKALWSQPYTNKTKHAILRFLSGYTACALKTKRGFGGWQNAFASKDSADKYLVKLKRKKKAEPVTEPVLVKDAIKEE